MVVDVRVTARGNVEVERAVTRDLVEHVIEKRHPGGQARLAAAVEIDLYGDPGFQGIPTYFCVPHEPFRAIHEGRSARIAL
jgi:hypothetical protein